MGEGKEGRQSERGKEQGGERTKDRGERVVGGPLLLGPQNNMEGRAIINRAPSNRDPKTNCHISNPRAFPTVRIRCNTNEYVPTEDGLLGYPP